jgi:SAM-dependent methyltransferase
MRGGMVVSCLLCPIYCVLSVVPYFRQMTVPLIDWPRVQHILDECPPLDDHQGYYRQYAVPRRSLDVLVPDTRTLLQAAFGPGMRVLDIGCGRADTLLASASLFARGVGIDESAAMLAGARAARASRDVSTVDFVACKAAALPFPAGSFDLAFSERGPMGHNDVTLREALRVLRPGASLFIETVGEWNGWESRLAFEPGYQKPTSLTRQLEVEAERLLRHDLRIHTLATRLSHARFASLEDWLRFQIYNWNSPGREAFTEARLADLHRFQTLASDAAGQITVTGHTLWLAATKQ